MAQANAAFAHFRCKFYAPTLEKKKSASAGPKLAERKFPIERTRDIGIARTSTPVKRRSPTRSVLHRNDPQDGQVHEGTPLPTDGPGARTRNHDHFGRDDLQLGAAQREGVLQNFRRDQQRINIIDTPGPSISPPKWNVHFACSTARSGVLTPLPACSASETVWRQARSTTCVPRFHQQDGPCWRDFNMSIDSMRKKLGANAWPVLLPLGKEDQLKGQLDVINKKAIIYSDSDQLDRSTR